MTQLEPQLDSRRAAVIAPLHPAIPAAAYTAGTLHATDRSRQYRVPDPEEMLRAINEGWTKIRENEKAIRVKDNEIAQLRKKVGFYRVKNIALTSIITGLAWEGIKAISPALWHLVH